MYHDTEQAPFSTQSANKRPAPASDISTKKRAPYASRACDACRRRKGRCSGDNPCAYCASRSLECGGASEPPSVSADVVMQATTPPRSLSSRESWSKLSTTSKTPFTRSGDLSRPMPEGSSHDHHGPPPDMRMLSSLGDLVASLQEQVGALTTKIVIMERSTSSQLNEDSPEAFETSPKRSIFLPNISAASKISPGRRHVHPKRFCGPTSPDYSLNMAQMRMQCNDNRPRLASIDDNQSDDEDLDSSDDDHDGEGTASVQISGRALDKLTEFRRLLGKVEAIQLLYTYQAVFGDFHPIVDMENTIRQTEGWYAPKVSTGAADQESLLVVNLMLAIALCAEPASGIDVAKAIYTYCREAIGRTIVCPTPRLSKAVILLLVGTYHFFKDDARYAWRMAGLAGNMLLELGLHSRDVPEHTLVSDTERAQVMPIICTTIVLDRQWSAAMGLPTHFHDSELYHTMKMSSVESPYLRAMVAFMAVSDKFTSPISRVAKTGQPYEQDDAFDILNFQIEQWRKKALDAYNFSRAPPKDISRIPSWAVLLNLRANAAHSMLLRPFFFNNTAASTVRKHIEPAMHYFSDTISILSDLDQLTEVYRKQTPFYVHLLASACALMSLVVAHVLQNRAALMSGLPNGFASTLGRSFRKAISLAGTYSATSRASKKLWKRLDPMTMALVQLGVLRSQSRSKQPAQKSAILYGSQGQKGKNPATATAYEPWQQAPSTTVDAISGIAEPLQLEQEMMLGAGFDGSDDITRRNVNIVGSEGDVPNPDCSFMPQLSTPLRMHIAAMDGSAFNNMASFGGSSGFYDWPFVDGQTFFSEGELLFEE